MSDDDERLFALFDDLEQQAEAVYRADREAELAERGQAEYSAVRLVGRLMASVDHEVGLGVEGLGVVTGRLDRVAVDSCRLSGSQGARWLVRLAAVTSVRGASRRAVAEEAWSPLTRLGVGSGLRALTGRTVAAHLREGTRWEGVVRRVGADFFELEAGDGTVLLALTALAAVRSEAEPD